MDLIVALSQHAFGRHIWDVPISMGTESSALVSQIPSVFWEEKRRYGLLMSPSVGRYVAFYTALQYIWRKCPFFFSTWNYSWSTHRHESWFVSPWQSIHRNA